MPVSDWLAPLAGVVIGAVCTGGVQRWAEKRRDSRELRAETRLIAEELTTNQDIVDRIKQRGKWPARDQTDLKVQRGAWETHRRSLAAADDPEPFDSTSPVYGHLWKIELLTDAYPDLPPEYDLHRVLEAMDKATEVIASKPGQTAATRLRR